MAGFKYRKSLSGVNQGPAELHIIGANSIIFQVGDVIRINTGGFAALFVAGDLTLGVVTGVHDKNGIKIDPDSATTDTYTMASDNQTVAQKKVSYIPTLQDYLFYNDSDDTLAQTNLMQYFPLNDENDVNGSSSSDGTLDTVRLVEIDPDNDADASKGIWQFVESFWAQNAGGTVDTAGIEA
jgi:hypothetical protein